MGWYDNLKPSYENETGWVKSDGSFVQCDDGEHSLIASQELQYEPKDLEDYSVPFNTGWVRIAQNSIESKVKPNPSQIKTILSIFIDHSTAIHVEIPGKKTVVQNWIEMRRTLIEV